MDNCGFCFNSIKVQLEHGIEVKYISEIQFQFHKGSIRTAFLSASGICSRSFNSIKVQLEHKQVF